MARAGTRLRGLWRHQVPRRVALFEVLAVTGGTREIIARRASTTAIERAAVEAGMTMLSMTAYISVSTGSFVPA